MRAEDFDLDELLRKSALRWPPCLCGDPECPDAESEQQAPSQPKADDRSFSPTMQRLRPLVEKANRRAGGHW